ncbi:MAG: thymidylate kinase [Candidatus Nanopelagicales bacterium]
MSTSQTPRNSRVGASGIELPAPLNRPTRARLWDELRQMLGGGARWAVQGGAGALELWLSSDDSADLDIWIDADGDEVDALVARSAARFPVAEVARATHPRRLTHRSLAVLTAGGLAVLDFTYGDLAVGPILLVPADDVTVSVGEVPELTGVAGAADRLLRPLLRGKLPSAERVAAARAAWGSSSQQGAAQRRWEQELGAEFATAAIAILSGADSADLPAAAALGPGRVMRATLAPRALLPAIRSWRSVLPVRRPGPVGLRTRGTVVALVGTDGSGKSTVAGEVRQQLEALGVPTSEVYFGMARGNLPGVGLARRLLGVAPAGGGQPVSPASVPTRASAPEPDGHPPTVLDDFGPTAAADLAHANVRRAAAWFYAVEYGWRYLRSVAPARLRGRAVIVDRYVYDLRESPWPGSRAAWVAQRVIPAPDVIVLPDAPAAQIHDRKPERPQAEQADQQRKFARLLAERPARVAALHIDTSGADPDSSARAVAAILTAAHAPRWRR